MSHTPTDLLLACLQFDDPAARPARLRVFSAADWEAVLAEGQRLGVLALLAGRLLRMDSLPLPEAVRGRLQAVRRQAGAANLRLYHALGQILERLAAAGIPAIVLKGAHLAELVYADIAMRPMADIDLLVKPADLGRAYETILGMGGYRSERRFRLERVMKEHYHLPPLLADSGPLIEIHWDIVQSSHRLTIDVAGIWQRSQPVQLGGAPALVMSVEDLLVHLSLHLFKDRLEGGLKHLYDISQTLSAYPDIDWIALDSIAHAWGGQRGVYLALHLAVELLNASVPSSVLVRLCLDVDSDSVVFPAVLQRILEPAGETVHPDLAHLWGKRPLKARAAAFWKVLFPYPEYVAGRYDLPARSPWVYPYYLVRLKDLLKRYARQAWRVARHDPAAAAQAEEENLLYEWWARSNKV